MSVYVPLIYSPGPSHRQDNLVYLEKSVSTVSEMGWY